MEVIQSNKGSRKLLNAGFAYTKKSQSKSTIRWECSQRIAKSCKGALVTDLLVTDIKSSVGHSHEPDFFANQALRVRAEIKSSAEANRGNPGQIVTDKLSLQSKEVIVAAGSKNALKQTARRAKKGTSPKDPSTIAEIPVPFPDEYAGNVIYDNESQQRVILFATDDGLGLLENADTWFMDGTHSTAPTQFQQLFVIRVPLAETCASAVYALLPSKQQVVYEEMLTGILDACLQRDIRPNPVRIVTDYEVAIHNAVRAVLSHDVHIQGCFYHLTQATWRRVQAEGLQAAYNSDEGVKTFCGKLDSLAFLPTADVANGMEVLREEAPENMTCLVDYFDANYVNGNFRSVVAPNGNLRLRKTSPRFCPTVWNVHEATLQDRDRTNNQCESWNHSFKHLVGHSNPSLWTVVSCLNKDATMVEADILRCERGEPPKKRVKKSTKAHQQRLKTLCQQYANGQKNIQEFLNAMGQFIRIN